MTPPPESTLAAAAIVWRRSQHARRISLRVDPRSGEIIVTSPVRSNADAARAFLLAQTAWVEQRLARLPPRLPLADGQEIPLHGRAVAIQHCPGCRGGAWLEGDVIHVSGDPSFLARRVADFCKGEAARALGSLAAARSAAFGLRLRRVAIKDTTSRWGSCTASGTIMFNWRLVMAPRFVQDYVVGHEVAHLRHMHHKPAFWALVDEITPHRTAALAWLRAGGPALLRVG